MNKLKKLILTLLLLCSTSTFANNGGGGFDDPIEAFNFYIKLAEKARVYRDKHGDYSQEHIKKLAPHVYANNKKYLLGATYLLSFHRRYVNNSATRGGENASYTVEIRHTRPYLNKAKGIVTVPYTYFRYQQKRVNGHTDRARLFKVKADRVGNKMKWFIYK